MRYRIDFNKTINQLVPSYMGGRKLILLLQAICAPLKDVNDAFVAWAKETRIEASMTSQVFKLEWYLNRKFSKYFADPNGRISIVTGEEAPNGAVMYSENANVPSGDNMVVRLESEGVAEESSLMHYQRETTQAGRHSFLVHSPAINTSTITIAEYTSMLVYYIDKYKLANKTYIIVF